MHHTLLRLSALASVIVLSGCTWWQPLKHNDNNAASSSASSSGPLLDEKQTASGALSALMTNDMTALAQYIHPKRGVRFTAETFVRTKAGDDGTPSDTVVYADQVSDLYSGTKTKTWGIAEGSGQPIVLTFAQYLAKYVADHDYRTATDVRWNHVMDRGSSMDNAKQVYPNAKIIEYHFDGFEPQYDGMDWASLRLVLSQDAATKRWYLVGVIHDHWTP